MRPIHTRSLLLGVSLALLTLASPASANDDPYSWASPPPSVQLLGDDSVLPAGKGAVFVPALGAAGEEPDVLFVDQDRVVKGPTGRRVVLAPGAYVALVGTGEPDQRIGVEVVVQEGKTTVVPVRWGGLRIESVSKGLKPRDDTYELVNMKSGKVIDLPREFQDSGESRPDTWLLEPGLYRIQEKGVSSVTSPNFTTVYVPRGGLVHHRLFVDRVGSIQGGGVVPAESYEDREVSVSPWTTKLVVGIDGSGTQTRNKPGFPDLTAAEGSAFADFEVTYTDDRSLIVFGADAEYGLMLLQPATGEPLPLIKSRDRLRADATYTLRLNDGAGVYVRGSGQTQMANTNAIATEDSEIAFRELDGTVRSEFVEAPKTYRIADAFQPLMINAGGGLQIKLSTTKQLDLSLRGGLGYRVMQFGAAYVPTDNPDTEAIEYTSLADFAEPGIEAGASATLRLTGFANYDTSFDAFTAFDGTGGIAVVWDNTLSVRLTRAVSLNYQLNASRVPWITEQISLRQGAFVRFGLNIL